MACAAALALRLPFEFPVAFTKYYVLRRHFTGGRKGFTFAMINAFFRFLRVVKLLEATAASKQRRLNSPDNPAP